MLIWALFTDIAPAKGGQKHIFRISRRDGQVLLEAAAETVEVQCIYYYHDYSTQSLQYYKLIVN